MKIILGLILLMFSSQIYAETLCEKAKKLYPEFSKEIPCPKDTSMNEEMAYLKSIRNAFMSPASKKEIYMGQFLKIQNTPDKGAEKKAYLSMLLNCGENAKLIYNSINRGIENSSKAELKVNFSRSNQFFTAGMLKYVYPEKGSTVTPKCKDDVFKYIDLRVGNYLVGKEETNPEAVQLIQTGTKTNR